MLEKIRGASNAPFETKATVEAVKMPAKKKTGRPSDYTEDLAESICARLAQGESMRKISLDDDMPSCKTMFTWLRVHESFLQQYETAKAECADMYAEEIIEIADDTANDYIDVTDDNGATGATRLNTEHVQRSRLRIDSRKWIASKLKPKKYGDKIQQEITAPEGVVFNMQFSGGDDE